MGQLLIWTRLSVVMLSSCAISVPVNVWHEPSWRDNYFESLWKEPVDAVGDYDNLTDEQRSVSSTKDFDQESPTFLAGESQQVSKIVFEDPEAHETGKNYDQGKENSHEGGFKKESGEEDHEEYKSSDGYEDSHFGKYGKHKDSGFYDKGGKTYKGGDHKSKYYKEDASGAEGSKGQNFGVKGHTNKGKNSKGFKNVFHKEEFGLSKDFYEDKDKKKSEKKFDLVDSFFKAVKGGNHKKSAEKGGKKHDSYGKKGFSKEGKKHSEKGGSNGKFGTNKHHSDDSAYGEKSGTAKEYGSKDHDGLGSYSNNLAIRASANNDHDPIVIVAQSSDEEVPIFSPDAEHSDSVVMATIVDGEQPVKFGIPLNSEISDNSTKAIASHLLKLLQSHPSLDVSKELPLGMKANQSLPVEISTSSTHSLPKIEIILKKETPKSRGYSYLQTSEEPEFNNCTNNNKDCTAFQKHSHSSFSIEYTDTDFDDDFENDYYDDSDIEEPSPDEQTNASNNDSETGDLVGNGSEKANPGLSLQDEQLLKWMQQVQQNKSLEPLVNTIATYPRKTYTDLRSNFKIPKIEQVPYSEQPEIKKILEIKKRMKIHPNVNQFRLSYQNLANGIDTQREINDNKKGNNKSNSKEVTPKKQWMPFLDQSPFIIPRTWKSDYSKYLSANS